MIDADQSTDQTESESAGCEPIGDRVSTLLALLGKSHTTAILFHLVYQDPRPWRFNELEDVLDISPNTLTERLKELVSYGLLTRTAYDEIPPRVEYDATEKATALMPVFQNLYRWAHEHDLEPVDEGQ
jgi:DNA-binding HxlR family transcriptional regulator